MNAPLKLFARDEDDLAVVSSFLQDAIVPVVEMKFLPDERWFGWEDSEAETGADAVYERINCAVQFDGVDAARHRGIDPSDRRTILSLLAIRPGESYIELIFSGGGTIRLATGAIDCRLDDLDHRWPTRLRPHHERD